MPISWYSSISWWLTLMALLFAVIRFAHSIWASEWNDTQSTSYVTFIWSEKKSLLSEWIKLLQMDSSSLIDFLLVIGEQWVHYVFSANFNKIRCATSLYTHKQDHTTELIGIQLFSYTLHILRWSNIYSFFSSIQLFICVEMEVGRVLHYK